MNITVTGSLGHISKPLTLALLRLGHAVTVISSNQDKQPDIEALGATAAIGRLEDGPFLVSAFAGADAVYLMEPPVDFFDAELDYVSYYTGLARTYAAAVRESGVKKVIHLSSIGAHTDQGTGMLAFHYHVEQIMNELPADVAIAFMRPVGFYYNLLASIPMVRAQGAIVANYGDLEEPWVSPLDIAAAIIEELVQPFEGRKFRYIASDELTCDAVARTLGAAIGKPDLKWTIITDEQLLSHLRTIGMNEQLAQGYVEMNAGRRNKVLYEDYYRNRPVLGIVKLSDFAKDFAAVYNQQPVS